MAKKLMSVFVALAVVVTMTILPITAYATDNGNNGEATTGTATEQTAGDSKTAAVAQIGDTTYTTFEEAFKNVKAGETITLLADVELSSTLNFDKNITLDLNGCKISNGSTVSGYLMNVPTGIKVTIKGDKKNSQIADNRSNVQGTVTTICVLGELTVDGSNLTISREGGIAIKVDEGKAGQGTLTVKGATITAATVKVEGGSSKGQAIQNWGTTTINSGTFNGNVDTYAYYGVKGEITIENGTFNGDVFAAQLKYGGQWATVSAKVNIKGGTFNGTLGEYYDDGTNGTQPIERLENKPDGIVESVVTVSGGTFANDPSAFVDTTKYAVTKGTNGYTLNAIETVGVVEVNGTKYDTFADAIKNANAGDTIKLIKDVAINPKEYDVNKRLKLEQDNVVIDLNGKTLYTPNCTLTIAGDGITIKNGTMATVQYGSYVAQITGKNVVVNGVTTFGGFNVSGDNSNNPDNPDATATITNCNITATKYYTVCAQRNSESIIKNCTLIGGSGDYFFWVEAKKYKEGDADPANFDAKLSYEKSTVKFVGEKKLYNTDGVAPIAFYTVTVDPFNGSAVAVKTVNDGDTISLTSLGTPVREGYTFKGWYNGEAAWTDSSVINDNLTIVARWEKNKAAEDTTVDTKTDTKTDTDTDGNKTTTTTETVKETAKDGTTTTTVTEDATKTSTDGTTEKTTATTETKTDKSGSETVTKNETVTKTDATGAEIEKTTTEATVTTKDDTTTTNETVTKTDATGAEIEKTTTEATVTKKDDATTTKEVKTVEDKATNTTTKTEKEVVEADKVTTTEQTVTTTDANQQTTVVTTKQVEDKASNVAVETKVASGVAKTEAKIADDQTAIPTTVKTVTVDATAAKVDANDVKKTEVTLPKETVDALNTVAKAAQDTTVELKTDVATLEIDNTALQTLTKATEQTVANDQSLVLTVAKTDSTVKETENATATFELTAALVDSQGQQTKVFEDTDAATNGTIKVNVAYTPEKADNTIEVYYVADNGEKTKMDATYKDGVLSWDTNHFSTYEVQEIAKATPDPTPVNPDDNKDKGKTDKKTTTKTVKKTVAKAGDSASTGDTTQLAPWMALVLISGTALIAVAVIGRRKSHNK